MLKSSFIPRVAFETPVEYDIQSEYFRKNASMPKGPYLAENILIEYFSDVIDECRTLFGDGKLEFEDTDISAHEELLAKLINRCKTIEEPQRGRLEKICVDIVSKHFQVPEDSVLIESKIVGKVTLDSKVMRVSEIGNYEYENDMDMVHVMFEVDKRRMIKYLSTGYAMGKAYVLFDRLSEYGISEELILLYKKIMMLNQYIMFNKPSHREITDKNKNDYIIGTVELALSHDDEQPKITAQGTIFPALLTETIKGFMELFSSHGLPKDRYLLDHVLAMTDSLEGESFDMIAGPALWRRIGMNVEMKYMPYFFRRLSLLKYSDSFIEFMRNVLINSKDGKKVFKNMVVKSMEDKEMDEFTDKITSVDTDRNIIADEYIHPSEL